MVSLNKFLIHRVFLAALFSVGIVKTEEAVKTEENSLKTEEQSKQADIINNVKKFYNEVATTENINWLKERKNVVSYNTEKIFVNNSAAINAVSGFFFGRASVFSRYAKVENLPQGMAKAAQKGLNRNVIAGTGLLILNVCYNNNRK